MTDNSRQSFIQKLDLANNYNLLVTEIKKIFKLQMIFLYLVLPLCTTDELRPINMPFKHCPASLGVPWCLSKSTTSLRRLYSGRVHCNFDASSHQIIAWTSRYKTQQLIHICERQTICSLECPWL